MNKLLFIYLVFASVFSGSAQDISISDVEEEKVPITINASVVAQWWIDELDSINLVPQTVRLIPGQEYILHLRATGYLPVDLPIVVDTDMDSVYVEMERDEAWQIVVSGFGAGKSPEIVPYEDGFALSGDAFKGDVEWYYYQPDTGSFSELDQSPYSSNVVPLDLGDIEPIRYPSEQYNNEFGMQRLRNGDIIAYPASRFTLVIYDTVNHNTYEYFTTDCALIGTKNDYVLFLEAYDLIVDCGRFFWIEGDKIREQSMIDFFGLGCCSKSVGLVTFSENNRYWILITRTYGYQVSKLWVYDSIEETFENLGTYEPRFFSFAWKNNETLVATMGSRVIEHNVETGQTIDILEETQINQFTTYRQALSLDAKWIMIYGGDSTIDGGQILIRNLYKD